MTRTNKKLLIYIAAILIAGFQLIFVRDPVSTIIPVVQTPKLGVSTKPNPIQNVKVIRVVDGDTFEIEGKIKVRYIGINTPEIYHDTTGKKTGEQCFANEAYLENKKLIEGKTVNLIKDVSDKDKYGRLLRYVYLDSPVGSSTGNFINEYLIKNGYAKIMTIKPDTKYSKIFSDDEKFAKINNLGIWKTCQKM